jgi:hypothetical protein
MQFEIIVTVKGKGYKMQVNRIYEGDTIESFELTAGGKSVVLQTNYHYLKSTNSKKSPDWKIISGEVGDGVAFALTIRALEYHFRTTEKG